MTLPSTAAVAGVFLRLAIGLLVMAWSVWSLRRIWLAIADVRRRWGKWDTFPIPDKKATWHITMILGILGGWALFTAGLTFWLAWSFGV